MSATRENVLAAIVQYVDSNKRRAPAHEIAMIVNDSTPNVQAIIKTLVIEGVINASRGRNGGALPDGVTLEKKVAPKKAKVAKVETAPTETADAPSEPADSTDETAVQFAALMEQLDRESELVAEPAPF